MEPFIQSLTQLQGQGMPRQLNESTYNFAPKSIKKTPFLNKVVFYSPVKQNGTGEILVVNYLPDSTSTCLLSEKPTLKNTLESVQGSPVDCRGYFRHGFRGDTQVAASSPMGKAGRAEECRGIGLPKTELHY